MAPAQASLRRAALAALAAEKVEAGECDAEEAAGVILFMYDGSPSSL